MIFHSDGLDSTDAERAETCAGSTPHNR
jgi:hypothetical protein